MNIIEIVNNLYTNKSPKWIEEVEESEIQPFVIQQWLVQNDSVRVQNRWLDKYTFTIPPRMWLSLAWSVIPKFNKPPFVKFTKKLDEEEEYKFILDKIRHEFKLSDSDYNTNRTRLIKQIKKEMPLWFKYYGIEKVYWKKYYLDFNYMKQDEKPKVVVSVGLSKWGI